MAYFKESRLETNGPGDLYCVQCGQKIDGAPYQASFSGWCACFDPVHFCSEECWEESEEFNTDNWD